MSATATEYLGLGANADTTLTACSCDGRKMLKEMAGAIAGGLRADPLDVVHARELPREFYECHGAEKLDKASQQRSVDGPKGEIVGHQPTAM